jgi:glycerophosphoryl diester phosphodiesterase
VKTISLVLLVPVVGYSIVVTSLRSTPAPPSCRSPQVVCGHRGSGANASGRPPENTLPSFRHAESSGAAMIELDVRRSADGTVMVIHDDRIDRTTTGRGCVAGLDAVQIRAEDASAGTDWEGAAVSVPTLDEALDAIDVDVNIEVKTDSSLFCARPDPSALAAGVVAAMARDPKKSRRLIVSSFDVAALDVVRRLEPGRYLGLLSVWPGDSQVAVEHGLTALHLWSGSATDSAIRGIRRWPRREHLDGRRRGGDGGISRRGRRPHHHRLAWHAGGFAWSRL